MSGTDTIQPYPDSPAQKKEQVRLMFNRIAPKYDFLNHLLSLSIDRCWRMKCIRILRKFHPAKVLDVATGTGDLAILAAVKMHARVTATDISEEMLSVARSKIQRRGLNEQIDCFVADAEHLPFESNSFDAAMVAFGVRNFSDPLRGLSEMCRVLNKNGILLVLEFSMPRKFPVKQLYSFYFRRILPGIGSIISKDPWAYHYLNRSAEVFPSGEAFCYLLSQAGFGEVKYIPLSFGIAHIYYGIKPASS